MIDLWYRDAVIYSLNVETFADGNGDGIGDFQGLTARLPYLAGIGVTCLWLLPFYPSPLKDDGYDISDYYGVHPRLGTLGDFVEFMNHAREYGIRVIVDLVVNHTSDKHPWFQAASTDPTSRYHDWYVWSKQKPADADQGMVFPGVQKTTWTWEKRARAYYFHRFYDFEPDLDPGNPDVRAEIEKIMGFWLQLGVTGFRVDAAPFMVQHKGTGKDAGREEYGYLTDFHRFLSWRRGDAMLLAEANVPPNEVLNYFGDANRMQMVFNFFANQHLFLAIAREDAAPLVRAMQQLPALPPTAQWANFLRNHDELDLGRLSDEDRQACFAAYGPEPSMQLYDRGIRRRMMPMLQGDRRRWELANSLMFTLPGTPVIRYGEEIGMGDNLDLPERNSIRTPMQWSAEPNGGFSTAPPNKLVRPVIAEGEYRYDQVNVMSQRLDPASPLNWMERAIRTRKECPEFGWGNARFLKTDHPAVMAHACEWNGQTVIAVHNFSRSRVAARVAFPENAGQLLHLYGRDVHQSMPAASNLIDLDGYDYRWLRVLGTR